MEYNNGIILTIPRGLRVTSLNNNDMNNLSDIKSGTFSCNFSIDSRAHVCETRDKLKKLLRFLVTKLLDVRDDEF